MIAIAYIVLGVGLVLCLLAVLGAWGEGEP